MTFTILTSFGSSVFNFYSTVSNKHNFSENSQKKTFITLILHYVHNPLKNYNHAPTAALKSSLPFAGENCRFFFKLTMVSASYWHAVNNSLLHINVKKFTLKTLPILDYCAFMRIYVAIVIKCKGIDQNTQKVHTSI